MGIEVKNLKFLKRGGKLLVELNKKEVLSAYSKVVEEHPELAGRIKITLDKSPYEWGSIPFPADESISIFIDANGLESEPSDTVLVYIDGYSAVKSEEL